MSADRFARYVGKLSDEELLELHRVVCRRAGVIYRDRYEPARRLNFEAAMSNRDTRFVRGLSPLENVRRAMGARAP